MRLDETVVRNTTAVALQVRVFPVILGQQVDGAFTFSEAPRDLNAASKILTPSETEFRMEPDSEREIEIRWNLLPSDARAAHLGVVFESKADSADDQQVKTVQRLLAVRFIRLPGGFDSSGELTRLRASQGPDRTLFFYPRILNTGETADSPENGRFRIRNADSDVVFETDWEGNVVLPDAQREFPIEMKKVLQAGEYAAVATADFGDSKSLKVIARFTLVGPNELPTGRVVIEGFRGEGVLGGDSKVTGTISSTGTAPATTAVRLDLYRLLENGQQPVEPMQSDRLEFDDPIEPGSSVPLEQVYPGLAAGDYRVIGTYRAEEGKVEEVVTDFAPQEERPEESSNWFSDNLGVVLGILGALLLLLLLTYLLRRQRRLRRELEAARSAAAPAPVAPAPAAAAATGVVDINTAGLADLQTLPGIGPKAADRIVAHRDEYGPFTSLDDLAQVEGFSDKRIEALRERARV